MASLDSLPADQRAVIQLVLQRGRSYDDIAAMLSIDRAAVRQRALDGFDALGPSNSIAAPQRALITDYLLGQLPPRVGEQVNERLATSPPDRAWARVIASEIGSLASSPLPEIPVGPTRPAPAASAPGQREERAEREEHAAEPRPRPVTPLRPAPPRRAAKRPAALDDDDAQGRQPREPQRGGSGGEASPPASRRGGAILLGLLAVVIIAVVLVTVLTSGGSSKHHSHTTAAKRPTTTGTSPTTTGTSTTKAKLLHQVNLISPTKAKAAGIADVIAEGSQIGIVLEASGVPANTAHNAYAVWLYTPGGASKFIGFVDASVGSNGKLETEGPLPANASQYKEMLVTLETVRKPTTPGPIVLEGAFSEG
jgi:hypothetical protein